MATGLKDRNDIGNRTQDEYDRRFDNIRFNETASNLNDLEQKGNSIIRNDEDERFNKKNGAENAADNVRDQEQNPNASWSNNVVNSAKNRLTDGVKKKFNLKSAIKKNPWKTGGIMGGAGISGLFISLVFMMLPMKFTMFIQNITDTVNAIPEYAITNRLEYMATKLIATRVLMKGADLSEESGKLLFCKTPSISCSLFKTYSTDFIEKRYGLQMERINPGNGKLGVKITTKRESLGGEGKSWTIEYSKSNNLAGGLTTIEKEMTRKEMKKYIGDHVNKKMQHRSIVSRFLVRRIMMQKYGVKSWKAFEATRDKLDNLEARIRSKLLVNTVGKISPKLTQFLACFEGPSLECAKTLDRIKAGEGKISKKEEPKKEGETAEDYKKRIEANAAGKSGASSNVAKAATEEFTEDTAKEIAGKASSMMARNVLKVAGWVAILDIIHTVMSGINSIDEGTLDVVSQDVVSSAYAGFAFGDEVGVITNAEKMKMGQLDPAMVEKMMKMFENVETSPLMAVENGMTHSSQNTYRSKCETLFDGVQDVNLPKGQLTCDNQRIVRGYTSFINNIPGWGILGTIAKGWMYSIVAIYGPVKAFVGEGIEVFTKFIMGIASAFVPDGVKEFMSKLVGDVMQFLFNFIIGIPPMGFEATGGDNYVALSGAIHSAGTARGANGVQDGQLYGIGGKALTKQELGKLEKEHFDKHYEKPTLASLFDPKTKGSLTQKLVMSTPTTTTSAIAIARSIPSSIITNFSTPANAAEKADTTIGAFGEVPYGYTSTEELEADPSTYTAEACEASAKKREDSLKKVAGFDVPVYTETDPCALEKTVVGVMLEDAGVKEDPNKLVDPLTEGQVSAPDLPAGAPGEVKYMSFIPSDTKGVVMTGNIGSYPGHAGADFARGQTWTIQSACSGKVVMIRNGTSPNSNTPGNPVNTNMFFVECEKGVYFGYMHYFLRDLNPLVKPGAFIPAGTPLFPQADQGNSYGAHLHFQVNKTLSYDSSGKLTGDPNVGFVDPIAFMASKGVALPGWNNPLPNKPGADRPI